MYSDELLLKRLFKLSRPSQWPRDLISVVMRPEYRVLRGVVREYMKRIPQQELTSIPASTVLARPILTTPLHDAITAMDLALVRQLIQEQPELLFTRNQTQQTPLMLVTVHGYEDLVELILNAYLRQGRFALDSVDRDGDTVVHYALYGKHQSLILKFLNMGAWAYRPNRIGFTPLMAAAKTGLTLVIDAYKEANLLHERNKSGFTALHYAAFFGQMESVAALLRAQVPIDEVVLSKRQHNQCTPLHLAAWQGHAAVVTLLIEQGASITARDARGFGLSEYLVLNKKIDMHHLLHQLPSMEASQEQPRLLKAAIIANNDRVLKELVLAQAHLTSLYDEGNNLLHLAALHDAGDCIAILLDCRALHIDQYNRFGCTPLHLAARFGHVRIIEQLIEAGGDLNKKTQEGQSALMLSIEAEQTGAVLCLLKYAASIQEKTPEGLTLAQLALSKGLVTMAAYLIYWGQDTGCSRDEITALSNPLFQTAMLMHLPALDRELQQLAAKPRATLGRARFGLHVAKPLIVNPYHELPVPEEVPPVAPTITRPVPPQPMLLSAVSIHQLTHTERKALQGLIDYILNNHPKQVDVLPTFIAQALVFRNTFGQACFYRLFNKNPKQSSAILDNFSTILQQLQDLKEEDAIYTAIREYGDKPDINHLMCSLATVHQQWFDRKYPDRPVAQVLTRFAQTKHPLPDAELAQMSRHYAEFVSYRHSLMHQTKDTLIDNITLQCQAFAHPQPLSIQPELLASVLQLLQKLYHIRLYDTQVLAILALLQKKPKLSGRILQINTGEGKSAILAVTAAYFALFGWTVDTVNTSSYLAKRDYAKYLALFTALGVKSLVQYTTSHDLSFEKLNDDFLNTKKRGHRARDIVLIDEVDNLFLDMAMSSVRNAVPGTNNFAWVYSPIYRYVQRTQKTGQVRELRAELSRLEFGKYQSQLAGISDQRLARWIESAYEVMNHKKRDVDYIVRYSMELMRDEIVIIDRAYTGQPNDGCQWQNGQHQFLQVKEQLEVTPESLTAGMISYGELLKEYQGLYGVTGSIGETCERDEILTLFAADSYDIPPYFDKQLTVLPTQIAATKAAQYEQIYQALTQIKRPRQPALVTLYSIEETKLFARFLRDKDPRIPQQVIDGTDSQQTNYLIENATRANMVNITTNFGGRGIDFVLPEPAVAAGGLFNILTTFSENLRAEIQTEGRAARQGEKGMVVKILSLDDRFILSLPKLQQIDITRDLTRNAFSADAVERCMDSLVQCREKSTQIQSQQRKQRAEEDALVGRKQKQFAVMNQRVDATLNDPAFTREVMQYLITYTPGDFSVPELPLSPRMQLLCQQAAIYMAQNIPAWSNFYEQFKSIYLKDMLYCWTGFNERLKDQGSITEERVESIYKQVESDLGHYTADPQKNILMWLARVLNEAHKMTLGAAHCLQQVTEMTHAPLEAANYKPAWRESLFMPRSEKAYVARTRRSKQTIDLTASDQNEQSVYDKKQNQL